MIYLLGLFAAGYFAYRAFHKAPAAPSAPSVPMPPQAIAGALFTTESDGIVTWTDDARNALFAAFDAVWLETGLRVPLVGGRGGLATIVSAVGPSGGTASLSAATAGGLIRQTLARFDIWVDARVMLGDTAVMVFMPPGLLPDPSDLGMGGTELATSPLQAARAAADVNHSVPPCLVRFTLAGDQVA